MIAVANENIRRRVSRDYANQPVGIGMKPTTTALGEYIRECRLKIKPKLSQIRLAKMSGLHANQGSMLEVGKRRYLEEEQIKLMAIALQCDPWELRRRIPDKYVAKPKTELGWFIFKRRKELGLTLEEFAQRMKLTVVNAKTIEIGAHRTIAYGRAQQLAAALELDLKAFGQFVGGRGRTKPAQSKLGKLIRARREELALSQKALGQKLDIKGVSGEIISQMELGKYSFHRNDSMLQKVAEALDLDFAHLCTLKTVRKTNIKMSTPLGEFMVNRRFELDLTRRAVDERLGLYRGFTSAVEQGLRLITPDLVQKLNRALECEIPPHVLPSTLRRKRGNPRRSKFRSPIVVTQQTE